MEKNETKKSNEKVRLSSTDKLDFRVENNEVQGRPGHYHVIDGYSLDELTERVDEFMEQSEYVYRCAGGPFKSTFVIEGIKRDSVGFPHPLKTKTYWHQAVELVRTDNPKYQIGVDVAHEKDQSTIAVLKVLKKGVKQLERLIEIKEHENI